MTFIAGCYILYISERHKSYYDQWTVRPLPSCLSQIQANNQFIKNQSTKFMLLIIQNNQKTLT